MKVIQSFTSHHDFTNVVFHDTNHLVHLALQAVCNDNVHAPLHTVITQQNKQYEWSQPTVLKGSRKSEIYLFSRPSFSNRSDFTRGPLKPHIRICIPNLKTRRVLYCIFVISLHIFYLSANINGFCEILKLT